MKTIFEPTGKTLTESFKTNPFEDIKFDDLTNSEKWRFLEAEAYIKNNMEHFNKLPDLEKQQFLVIEAHVNEVIK